MSGIRKLTSVAVAGLIAFVSPSYAIFGIGAHYSLDLTVKMPDAEEQLTFDSLDLVTDAAGFSGLPSGWTNASFGPEDIPIYFDHRDMQRTPFAVGGKVYIDMIPFLDCIEFTGGFAAFQYDGKIKYPTGITVEPTAPSDPNSMALLEMSAQDMVTVEYDSISTNLEDIEGAASIPGAKLTPYLKLEMGVAVRKYINLPIIDRFIAPYGGVGLGMLFATPVPSAGLVNDALGDDLTGDMTIAEITAVMQDPKTPKKVVDELLARLMTPHFGIDLIVGAMVKPPILPFGVYVDGKYSIPFGKLDEDADVTGNGFKLNMGLALHVGKLGD